MPNLIHDTMSEMAATHGAMSGATADLMREALRKLSVKVVSQFKNAPVAQLIENNEMSADFVERLCGLKAPNEARSS